MWTGTGEAARGSRQMQHPMAQPCSRHVRPNRCGTAASTHQSSSGSSSSASARPAARYCTTSSSTAASRKSSNRRCSSPAMPSARAPSAAIAAPALSGAPLGGRPAGAVVLCSECCELIAGAAGEACGAASSRCQGFAAVRCGCQCGGSRDGALPITAMLGRDGRPFLFCPTKIECQRGPAWGRLLPQSPPIAALRFCSSRSIGGSRRERHSPR